MTDLIQLIRARWIDATVAYVLIGFFTYGWAYNRVCDGKASGLDLDTCPTAIAGFMFWPFYWVGKFFIWLTA